jgi:hypothetical protein
MLGWRRMSFFNGCATFNQKRTFQKIAHHPLLGILEQSVLMFGKRPYTLELMVEQQRILSIL